MTLKLDLRSHASRIITRHARRSSSEAYKPLDVDRQSKPGKYADGDGLYLIVTGPTSKSWSYRYWKDGKERWHGLGSLKDVSLKDARLARDAARLRVKGDRGTAGVDIVQERRKAREEAKAVEARVVLPTFEEYPLLLTGTTKALVSLHFSADGLRFA